MNFSVNQALRASAPSLISLIAILFLNLGNATAQTAERPENYCGVQMTAEEEEWLKQFQANPIAFERSGAADYYIPIKVHITGNDDGGGYYRLENLLKQMCELNDHFAPTGFFFYIDGDINYIDNQTFHEHDFFDGTTMMTTNNVSGAVNMYMVDDPAGNCGYYSGFGNAIAVAQVCATPGATTIVHELGHFFSLPHTFRGWEGGTTPPSPQQERVDGSNCNSAADGFCDTPPDYAAYRWNCPTTGPFTDPNGAVFTPDGTFYMSYSNDACTDKFSNEQSNAMVGNLTGPRDELLSSFIPSTADLDSVELVEPADGALDQPYNYVVLKWNAVENAEGYHVAVGYNALMTALVADQIISDTLMILTDLPTDRKLYWKVKPITSGNPCEDYSEVRDFRTGVQPSAIDSPDATADEINLFPNPVRSGQPLNIRFDSEQPREIVMSIMDLTGRVLSEDAFAVSTGQNSLSLQTDGMAAGLYMVSLRGEGFTHTQPITVSK